jgi:hypothetical protein
MIETDDQSFSRSAGLRWPARSNAPDDVENIGHLTDALNGLVELLCVKPALLETRLDLAPRGSHGLAL